MTPSWPYIIKSSVLLSAFLLYYIFFLKKQTFFTWNRVYLLATLILSVCTPLFHFNLTINNTTTESALPTLYYVSGFMEEISVSGSKASTHSLFYHLTLIYISGICFLILRYLKGLFQISKLIRSHKCKRIHKLKIIPVPSGYPVFSFFNCIFINTASFGKSGAKSVFEHERIHVRQGHSFDLLITEIICTLNWFNPLVWIYKKNIAQNHEYIADRQVTVKYQTGRYLQLLVNQALKGNAFSFSNCFSCSNLKKRMIMMTKKQSNKFNILNYIPALFIGGILCTAFTCIATETPALPFISENKTVTTEEILESPADTSAIFQVVETMPQFNGNMQTWLKNNVKYPVKAIANKEKGRVFVSFVVERNGNISNTKVTKGVSPLLDAEALRVVKSMPAWIPGKQGGQTVRVAFAVPINFNLSESPVFTVVETMPRFNGNMEAWIKDNLKYPEKSQKAKEEGLTFVGFVVNEDGSLSDFKIQRSSGHQALDEEALRITKAMPNWIPGKQQGKAVKVSFVVPFNFKL